MRLSLRVVPLPVLTGTISDRASSWLKLRAARSKIGPTGEDVSAIHCGSEKARGKSEVETC
jgi:hypothetical protein